MFLLQISCIAGGHLKTICFVLFFYLSSASNYMWVCELVCRVDIASYTIHRPGNKILSCPSDLEIFSKSKAKCHLVLYYGPDHVQVFWKHKSIGNISQLETRPLIGWLARSTNQRTGFELTYVSNWLMLPKHTCTWSGLICKVFSKIEGKPTITSRRFYDSMVYHDIELKVCTICLF